jgi:hypothetical protein
VAALAPAQLIIVDHRLTTAQTPIFDWRPGAAPAAAAPAPLTPGVETDH